uniref:RNA polymerase subunit H/Rpb5 C-terminal domain-containing protein n=1 Tax=viral metagenome TaxID=1070528 RepID=A0A6C0KHE4_9ZZZZ
MGFPKKIFRFFARPVKSMFPYHVSFTVSLPCFLRGFSTKEGFVRETWVSLQPGFPTKLILTIHKDIKTTHYIYTMSNANRILTLFKARKNILEILDDLDYETTDYAGFSINEIDAMYVNNQLDLLMNHQSNGKKVYVKFYLDAKQIRPANLDNIIEDLFVIDTVLTKNDTLIIITEDEPNDTIITKLKYLFDHDGIFVVIHNINRLQFNILNHKLVPPTEIIHDEAKIAELQKKFNIKSLQQLPEISRFDPLALAMCMRPGQICEINRNSATALSYKYYRICV